MIARLLFANRGEIAIRVIHGDLSLHTRHADESISLPSQGVTAKSMPGLTRGKRISRTKRQTKGGRL